LEEKREGKGKEGKHNRLFWGIMEKQEEKANYKCP
jgi:hypothetical protein